MLEAAFIKFYKLFQKLLVMGEGEGAKFETCTYGN